MAIAPITSVYAPNGNCSLEELQKLAQRPIILGATSTHITEAGKRIANDRTKAEDRSPT
jgi:hypothetical protein